MSDVSISLRIVLVIIGVLIIAGVYFLSARKRQQDSRVTYDRRFSRMDIPDVILDEDGEPRDPNDDWEIITRPASPPPPPADMPPPRMREQPAAAKPRIPASLEPRISVPQDVVLPPEDSVLNDLPAVRNDAVVAPEPSNARRRSDQLDLFGAPEAPPPARPSRTTNRAAAPPPAAPLPPDDGIIMLYVRAREGQPITGTNLVKGFNAVGMQHGDMDIFHHFGAGELTCDTAVFSAANMFEPGTFDLGRIEAFRTAGVALFLQLPGPLDGPVAFELLLNTAQRLTELVGAELYATPQTRLDSKGIARLRARAARFSHAAP